MEHPLASALGAPKQPRGAPRQNHALNIDGDLVCTFCKIRDRQLVLVSLILRPKVREDLLPPSELGLKVPLQHRLTRTTQQANLGLIKP